MPKINKCFPKFIRKKENNINGKFVNFTPLNSKGQNFVPLPLL